MNQKNKQTACPVCAAGLSAGDLAWADAQHSWLEGDVRLLAELVRDHDLSAEARAFVADILLGEVKQMDGRKVQRQTRRMMELYKSILFWNAMAERHGHDAAIIPEKEIWRMLDRTFSQYQPGTVKRMISRTKKAGHEKK